MQSAAEQAPTHQGAPAGGLTSHPGSLRPTEIPEGPFVPLGVPQGVLGYNRGPSMNITERRSGELTILELEGNVTRNDGYGACKQRVTELLSEGRRDFILNLRQVEYMDSTCVGELVSAFITVRNNGGVMKLASAIGRIKDLLTIAKLNTVLELYDTEEAAIASFTGQD